MKDIVMPKLSDTMTEGRLVAWRKPVGATVKRGDVIAEVETDKANMELEAFANGVILETRVAAGETVAVGTVIGVIGAAGEKPQGAKGAGEGGEKPTPEPPPKGPEQPVKEPEQPSPKAPEPAPEQPAPKPADRPEEKPAATPAEKAAPPAGKPVRTESAPEGIPAPEVTQAPFHPELAGAEQERRAPEKPEPREGGPEKGEGAAAAPERLEERAAPVVRKRARELGIDLASVQGSGPEGRILLQDLESAAPAAGEAGPAGKAPEQRAAGRPAIEEQQLSRFRSAIARTVTESWRQIPQYTVTVELFMDQVRVVRQDLKGSGIEISTNDIIVKAAALALAKFPLANGSFAGDTIHLHREINIGIVVALPNALFVPVIRGCGELSLAEISRESKRLIERARRGELTEAEMNGGTFTVSNLGMYGVNRFNAIIFPPQAAILAVGAVVEKVVARGGTPTVARVLELSLTADHRILDGVYVAQFLEELKNILEHPSRLFL